MELLPFLGDGRARIKTEPSFGPPDPGALFFLVVLEYRLRRLLAVRKLTPGQTHDSAIRSDREAHPRGQSVAVRAFKN
jgi:hypothetical protein